MIAVSFVLALYLGWPLAFGGSGTRVIAPPAEARSVASAPARPGLSVSATVAAAVKSVATIKPESCYKRYQREVKLCGGDGPAGAACRLGVADHWDMCESTGFWPN